MPSAAQPTSAFVERISPTSTIEPNNPLGDGEGWTDVPRPPPTEIRSALDAEEQAAFARFVDGKGGGPVRSFQVVSRPPLQKQRTAPYDADDDDSRTERAPTPPAPAAAGAPTVTDMTSTIERIPIMRVEHIEHARLSPPVAPPRRAVDPALQGVFSTPAGESPPSDLGPPPQPLQHLQRIPSPHQPASAVESFYSAPGDECVEPQPVPHPPERVVKWVATQTPAPPPSSEIYSPSVLGAAHGSGVPPLPPRSDHAIVDVRQHVASTDGNASPPLEPAASPAQLSPDHPLPLTSLADACAAPAVPPRSPCVPPAPPPDEKFLKLLSTLTRATVKNVESSFDRASKQERNVRSAQAALDKVRAQLEGARRNELRAAAALERARGPLEGTRRGKQEAVATVEMLHHERITNQAALSDTIGEYHRTVLAKHERDAHRAIQRQSIAVSMVDAPSGGVLSRVTSLSRRRSGNSNTGGHGRSASGTSFSKVPALAPVRQVSV